MVSLSFHGFLKFINKTNCYEKMVEWNSEKAIEASLKATLSKLALKIQRVLMGLGLLWAFGVIFYMKLKP